MKRAAWMVVLLTIWATIATPASAGPRKRRPEAKKISSTSVSKPYRYRPAPAAAIRIFPIGPGRPAYPSQ
jgi:hypothetical protein